MKRDDKVPYNVLARPAKDGYTKLRYEQSKHGWQLRVHVDASAIRKDKKTRQIAKISEILNNAFSKKDNVDIKIYEIEDESEYKNQYDGALSHEAKDRTQLGKEVCIYIPDANVEQLSHEDYKQKLLSLWKLLQDANIPLLHINIPGDEEITMLGGYPSPFSYTSFNPVDEKSNDLPEWKQRHGILFKTFKPHGKHPILNMNFTASDLLAHGIKLEPKQFLHTTKFTVNHSSSAVLDVSKQLDKLKKQSVTYDSILFDDNQSIEFLKTLIKKREGLDGEKLTAFKNELANNKHYQFLLNAYPHFDDADFNKDPLLDEIEKTLAWGQLKEQRAVEIISNLRDKYDSLKSSIKKDITEIQSSFPVLSFNEDNIDDLIEKNPANLQSIYRQLAIVKQEKDKLVALSMQATASVKLREPIKLLQLYKTNRQRQSANQYISFFGVLSRPFGAFSKSEKFSAVDALIISLNDPAIALDEKYVGPLKQGTLGALVARLQIDIDSFVKRVDEKLIEPEDLNSISTLT
jgi:hypothetical protein